LAAVFLCFDGFARQIGAIRRWRNKKSHVTSRRQKKTGGAGNQTDFEMLGICIHLCIHPCIHPLTTIAASSPGFCSGRLAAYYAINLIQVFLPIVFYFNEYHDKLT
jgi:hypothetical protein